MTSVGGAVSYDGMFGLVEDKQATSAAIGLTLDTLATNTASAVNIPVIGLREVARRASQTMRANAQGPPSMMTSSVPNEGIESEETPQPPTPPPSSMMTVLFPEPQPPPFEMEYGGDEDTLSMASNPSLSTAAATAAGLTSSPSSTSSCSSYAPAMVTSSIASRLPPTATTDPAERKGNGLRCLSLLCESRLLSLQQKRLLSER